MSGSNGPILGREAFEAAAKPRYMVATVPGFGPVRLRNLTTSEALKYEGLVAQAGMMMQAKKKADAARFLVDARFFLFRTSVVGGQNQALFSPADKGMWQELDASITQEIERAATEHSGLNEPAELEETAKN